MEIQTKRFSIESNDRFEILNISPEVKQQIEELSATNGLMYVSTPHTSAALSTNEHEEKLLSDMVNKFKELVPPDDGYNHDEDHVAAGEQPNAHAHLISTMIKQPVLLLLNEGNLDLGTWEEILFFELCGPRERTVNVTALQ